MTYRAEIGCGLITYGKVLVWHADPFTKRKGLGSRLYSICCKRMCNSCKLLCTNHEYCSNLSVCGFLDQLLVLLSAHANF